MKILGWLLVGLGVLLALGLLGPILGLVLTLLFAPIGLIFGLFGALLGGFFVLLGVLIKYGIPIALVAFGVWLLNRSNQPRLQQ